MSAELVRSRSNWRRAEVYSAIDVSDQSQAILKIATLACPADVEGVWALSPDDPTVQQAKEKGVRERRDETNFFAAHGTSSGRCEANSLSLFTLNNDFQRWEPPLQLMDAGLGRAGAVQVQGPQVGQRWQQ